MLPKLRSRLHVLSTQKRIEYEKVEFDKTTDRGVLKQPEDTFRFVQGHLKVMCAESVEIRFWTEAHRSCVVS